MGRQTRKQKKKFRNIAHCKWMFRELAVEEKKMDRTKVFLVLQKQSKALALGMRERMDAPWVSGSSDGWVVKVTQGVTLPDAPPSYLWYTGNAEKVLLLLLKLKTPAIIEGTMQPITVLTVLISCE